MCVLLRCFGCDSRCLDLLCGLFVDSVLYLALIVLGCLFLCFVGGLVRYLVCCADLLLCFVCCGLE